ncbi:MULTISPECIES: ATP-dependent zinc metalloprotease FtsH [Streptomyces]|uniref:ATP-dependent zinc metalloprotease FtsH n=1 Tax=Streptomyces tsukubensis (strain DSM 42081 / NBRC 108919 / NRRL 18488 / 9993) TaxID=1114943 RepID=I2N733_STRT9|nr:MULTISPECIES: ATP-dependent zinc metalloprotease FtsH [Streptomyces]AZK96765.1 cell division protein FtsH [Streptomyces tsukubensis]EIF92830.1 cell division protein FtsH-like protein [Streptomyces tsukubensis NRRL18488]MYS66932.1 ATP-dependent zinc metalloprotease FtsH [Streptomyces sp. SID5473]QKM67244.1 ATP-dependent metallopeptidase FtsH/Yme1/Tma family protein [Streptomyces tsukubensis NRRL18488]TAI41947.1 ATP-dependent metallopeptidase FtsH/Yme1/Tma family protein [Streptomyces tsukube
MSNPAPPRRAPDDPWRSEGTPPTPPPRRKMPGGWWGLLVAAAVVYLIASLVLSQFRKGGEEPTVSYTEFSKQVTAGNISKIYSKDEAIEGELKKKAPVPGGDGDYTKFRTQRPAFATDDLWGELTGRGVTVTAEPVVQKTSIWSSLLFAFLPILLLIAVWVFAARRMGAALGGGGGLLGRKEPPKPVELLPGKKRTTFADVAGIDEVEGELNDVVDFLKNPGAYRRMGARMPGGVLLAGPPGTGKTLLARAVAGEAGVPFFSASASEFIEMIVGVGAGRVRELFSEARKVAPAIVFIDEIDTIGRVRGGGAGLGGHDEREQTLNQILTEMDGFTGSEGVVVLAATNRADVLDPALTRPGRFDRIVQVSPPDRPGREAILTIHTREIPLAPDVDLTRIAAATPGMTGADLANLANEAALLAVKRREDAVTQSDLTTALEKVQLGAERPLVLSAEDRRRTAYHESGHALLGMLQPGADPVRKVTIVPRGRALGVTLSTPEADKYAYTEEYLRGRIIGALGGMAAEQLVYGVVTTGAESDLEQVTGLARGMVGRWGMSERVGRLTAVPGDAQVPYGLSAAPATLDSVDHEMRRIVDECYEEASRLLRENRHRLDALAQALLEHETLEEEAAYRAAGIPRLAKSDG